MKQYTHAWLAFMAVRRLKDTADRMGSEVNKRAAKQMVRWVMHHEDDIIQGAWYPDAVIKDMANSHVLKMTPSDNGANQFDTLPSTHLMYELGRNSAIRSRGFDIDKDDNLPDRCESITHSIIDNLKMQKREPKGSPVTPTSNHIALRFFMLSHYIADGHVPFHCDSRRFSEGANVHGKMEEEWDTTIKRHYEIDVGHDRFFYDRDGFPLRRTDREDEYEQCYLKEVEEELASRPFRVGYGTGRDNTWDFVKSICQYSYVVSHEFIGSQYNHLNVTGDNWDSLGSISLDDLSVAVLSDAIDSISRVWFRAWRRYMKWAEDQG